MGLIRKAGRCRDLGQRVRHVDLIITDNHSFRAEPVNMDAFTPAEFAWVTPQEAVEILDSGRAYNGGSPPDTIHYAGRDVPNPRKDAPPQSRLTQEVAEGVPPLATKSKV